MENSSKDFQITLTGIHGTSLSTVTVRTWSDRERMQRALKAWGLFWGLSLVSVILPLAHFLLVPGFFFAGPTVAWFFYHQKNRITAGRASCPQCKSEFEIVKSEFKFPLKDVCPKCSENVSITLA